MKSIFIKSFFFAAFIATPVCFAQTGTLRGGSVVLTDATSGHAVTLTPPGSGLTSFTWALPANKSTGVGWLKNDGSGNLTWDPSPNGLAGNGMVYTPGAPQNTAVSGNYLFYLRNQTALNNASSPGAFVTSSVVDGAASSSTGLTIDVTNTLVSATGVMLTGGCFDANIPSAGNVTSTQTAIGITATGTNSTVYGALFNGGNVGIGTSTPGEQLEVNGNIRISGLGGLKITEGTNATMGVVTLVNGVHVVADTKVTANSRIFLMEQNNTGANNGTPYVSARTAGVGFTITSTNQPNDVSDVAWILIEP